MKLMKPNVVDEADKDGLVPEAEATDEPEVCYETNAAIETDVAVASPAVAAAVVASAVCGNLCWRIAAVLVAAVPVVAVPVVATARDISRIRWW